MKKLKLTLSIIALAGFAVSGVAVAAPAKATMAKKGQVRLIQSLDVTSCWNAASAVPVLNIGDSTIELIVPALSVDMPIPADESACITSPVYGAGFNIRINYNAGTWPGAVYSHSIVDVANDKVRVFT